VDLSIGLAFAHHLPVLIESLRDATGEKCDRHHNGGGNGASAQQMGRVDLLNTKPNFVYWRFNRGK
jgi:hypothetical protein